MTRPASTICPDARLRYLAARIHMLGPRPLHELLRELVTPETLPRLEAYAALDARLVTTLGGRDLAQPRVICGGRGR